MFTKPATTRFTVRACRGSACVVNSSSSPQDSRRRNRYLPNKGARNYQAGRGGEDGLSLGQRVWIARALLAQQCVIGRAETRKAAAAKASEEDGQFPLHLGEKGGTSSQARLRNGDRPPAGLHTLMSVLGDSVSSTNRSTQACRSPEAQMSARTGSHLARAPRKVNNCTGSWPKMTPDCLPGGALATSESVVGINPARRTLNLRELRSLHTHH